MKREDILVYIVMGILLVGIIGMWVNYVPLVEPPEAAMGRANALAQKMYVDFEQEQKNKKAAHP